MFRNELEIRQRIFRWICLNEAQNSKNLGILQGQTKFQNDFNFGYFKTNINLINLPVSLSNKIKPQSKFKSEREKRNFSFIEQAQLLQLNYLKSHLKLQKYNGKLF